MKVELYVTKERVPYLVNELGEDRVTVSEYNEDQNKVEFEMTGQIDFLYAFHAGIRFGSDSMGKALLAR